MPKSPAATCFIAFESLTTGRSRMMLMTMDTVTPMIALKIIRKMISGISITRLRIILDSHDRSPDTASVPKISPMETMINSSRMLSSLSFFGFCICLIIA
jgi:hypothetical protein